MNYLTDTHSLIWSVLQPSKLSSKAKDILENPENRIFVSAINFWEISLKYSIGKLEFEGILPLNFHPLQLKWDLNLFQLSLKRLHPTTY